MEKEDFETKAITLPFNLVYVHQHGDYFFKNKFTPEMVQIKTAKYGFK
jgi:hypothetical protein